MTAMKQIRLSPFVNREEEVKEAYAKLKAIQKGEWLFDFILTISGIPGIGKTTLLEKINMIAKEQNIQTIFINFEKKEEKLYLVQKIAESMFPQDSEWQNALKSYQENPKDEPLITEFAKQLKSKLEKPLVLLIDNSHYLHEFAQAILEDILERVYFKNRLFVALAGRADWKWKSFELRRRTRMVYPTYFGEKETEQLIEPRNPILSKHIYHLTSGYPLASVQAYQWIYGHLEVSSQEFTEQLQKNETELIFELVDTILSKHILAHITDKDMRLFMDWLLKVVSMIRRFDDILLVNLLPTIASELYRPIDTLNTRSYIRKMSILTYVVKWNSAKMAYSCDDSIRRLLSLSMKFREKPLLIKIHEFMIEWYQQAIDEAVKKDPSSPATVIYLIEYIFHFVQLHYLTEQTEHLGFKIQHKIAEQFIGYKYQEKNHFCEEFKKDLELIELLGDNYHQLSEFVEKQTESFKGGT